MNKLFFILALIAFGFAGFVFFATSKAPTECAGLTVNQKDKVSFFPEYINSLLSPNVSPKNDSALENRVGCSVQPSNRYIPADALGLGLLFLILGFVTSKKESGKIKVSTPEEQQSQHEPQNDPQI